MTQSTVTRTGAVSAPVLERKLVFSALLSVLDVEPKPFEARWADVCGWFDRRHLQVREKKDGFALIPATFGATPNAGGGLRHAGNVETIHAVMLDLDGKDRHRPLAEIVLALEGYAAVAHSTFSHTAALPRFRVIVPLLRPVAPGQLKGLLQAFARETGLHTDPACTNPDRAYYLPASPASRADDYVVRVLEGRWLDAEALMAGSRPASFLPVGGTGVSASSLASPAEAGASAVTGITVASIENSEAISSILATPSILASAPPPPLQGRSLEAQFTDFDRLEPVLQHLGIEATRIGQRFLCVLPGHEETHPSAVLYQDRQGRVVYRCFHHDARFHTLGAVYAARFYGQTRSFKGRAGGKNPELAVWTLRLLVDAGVVAPARVALPVLPSGNPFVAALRPEKRRILAGVYRGIKLLYAVKWLHSPGEPTALSWRFAAAWCGFEQRQAQWGIQMLLRLGVIRRVGTHRAAFGNEMALFLPGPCAEALVSAAAVPVAGTGVPGAAPGAP